MGLHAKEELGEVPPKILPATLTLSGIGPDLRISSSSKKLGPPKSSIEYVEEVVSLSPLARRVLWGALLFLIMFNAALLGLFAFVYSQNEKNDSFLWLYRIYYVKIDGNRFLMANSNRVAIGYAFLCVCFTCFAVRMIWSSLITHELRFGSVRPRRSASSKRVQSAIQNVNAITRWIRLWYNKWTHAIGVWGPFFDIRLLAQELFEIGGQTAAAYSASQGISNLPLNVIYAVVIFLNCVSAHACKRIFKRSLAKQRLACLVTDLLLDFVWGSLLPIWMYEPVVKIYLNRANVASDFQNFTNSTREIERVLVVSWKNYAMSVIPFCSSLFNLLELHDILRDMSNEPKAAQISDHSEKKPTILAKSCQDAENDNETPPSIPLGPPASMTYVEMRYPVGHQSHGPLMKIAHAIIPLYGFAILLMVIASTGVFSSSRSSRETECLLRIHPWFTTHEACLGRLINCTALGINGSKAELETVLATMDKRSLSDLYIFSCPGLEMPSKIHENFGTSCFL